MRTTIGLAAIVILLGLAAVLVILGRPPPSETKSEVASSTAGFSSQFGSGTVVTSGVGGNASLYFALGIVPADLLVPVGGSGNYTLVVHPIGGIAGPYTASVKAPPGLSFKIDPTTLTLSASVRIGADFQVRSSSGMSPGDYPIFISLEGPQGVANQSFSVHVQKNLLFMSVGSTRFVNLTVKAGEAVTWVSRDGVLSDEPGQEFHRVIFQNMDVASPSLGLSGIWSYTFAQPGTYRYYDPGDYSLGEIVVVL